MNIIVTGSGGYIGSSLVDRLLKGGHSVWGVDRYFFGESIIADLIKHPNFTLVKNDIRFLTPKDFEGIDVVMDLAGLSNDPSCEIDEELTYSVNYKGSVNVAKSAKAAGVKQYIFSSSCSVYGYGKDDILTEKSPLNPISCYAKSKILAEEEIGKLSDKNFGVTFLRNATLFGLSRRMRFDLVINLMTLIAWKKNKIYITGGGKQWRPLIHIDDVVSVFMLMLKKEFKEKINGEVYNVGSDEQNFQIHNLAYIVQECFNGVELEIIPEDDDKRSYHVGFEKIKTELNFKAKETPASGAQQIKKALKQGRVSDDLTTKTLDYYKYLLKADRLLKQIKIGDTLF